MEDYIVSHEELYVYENQNYSFMKPPYMPFDEQDAVIVKLKEAFAQHEFMLLFGYSGCGKTTVINRLAPNYPDTVLVFNNFSTTNPTGLLVEIGNRFGIKLKQRVTEVDTLCERLKSHPYIMMIFDEVNATTVSKRNLLEKLELLRRIYMSCDISVVICGNTTIYTELHNSSKSDEYSSILSRLDELKMSGMKTNDAEQYFTVLSKTENVRFTHEAQQALIKIAITPAASGILGFVTIISRCITRQRALFYSNNNICIPEVLRVQDNVKRPVGNTIITLPVTNQMITIDESMVRMEMINRSVLFKNLINDKKKTVA